MPASVHVPVTCRTSNVPAACTLFAKSLRVAFLTSAAVVPSGRVEVHPGGGFTAGQRSNLIKLLLVELITTVAVAPKLFVGLVESVYVSASRRTSTPANERPGLSSGTATISRAVSNLFTLRMCFRMIPSSFLHPLYERRASLRSILLAKCLQPPSPDAQASGLPNKAW